MAEGSSIKRIAVVGAESTGKTWLCQELAKHYNTSWVPEYAREYFNDSDIYNYTLADLATVAKKQIEMVEEQHIKATRFLFCDTTLITLKIWSVLEFNLVPTIIEEGMKSAHYDFYFVTNNDVPWKKDELRQNKFSREMLFEMNLKEVKQTGMPYAIISGINGARLLNAINEVNINFGGL